MNADNPMLLWLPASGYECDEEFLTYAQNITNANGAVLDFCERLVTLSDTLERLDCYGVDVDDYLIDLDANLRQLGA